MSIFEHIDINAIKDDLYSKNMAMREAQERINKYYSIKTKKYMDFYRSFHTYALKMKIPIKVYKSTKLLGDGFKGWMITPRFGISVKGDFHYKMCEPSWNGIDKISYPKDNRPILFTQDESHWCRYDKVENVIRIKKNEKDILGVSFSVDMPIMEYYSKVEDLIDEQLKEYAEQCIKYALTGH